MNNENVISRHNTISRKLIPIIVVLILVALFNLVALFKIPDDSFITDFISNLMSPFDTILSGVYLIISVAFILAIFFLILAILAICSIDMFCSFLNIINIPFKESRIGQFLTINSNQYPFINFSVDVMDLLYERIYSIITKFLPKNITLSRTSTVNEIPLGSIVRDKTSIIDKHQNRIITIAILMACLGVFYHFVMAPQIKVWNYRSCKESAEKNYTNELFKACDKLNIRDYCDVDSVESNDRSAVIHRQLMQAYYKIEQCKTEANID